MQTHISTNLMKKQTHPNLDGEFSAHFHFLGELLLMKSPVKKKIIDESYIYKASPRTGICMIIVTRMPAHLALCISEHYKLST